MGELVPVGRSVVGTQESLERLLRERHAAGTLLTPPEQIKAIQSRTDPSKWAIYATFLEHPERLSLRQRWAKFDKDHPVAGPIFKALGFGLLVLAILIAVVAIALKVLFSIVSAAQLSGAGLLLLIVVGAFLYLARGEGGHGRHSGKGWHYTNCK